MQKLRNAFNYAVQVIKEPHSTRHMAGAAIGVALTGLAVDAAGIMMGYKPSFTHTLAFAGGMGMLTKIFTGVSVVNGDMQQTHLPVISNKNFVGRSFDFVKDVVKDSGSTKYAGIFAAVGGVMALATGAPVLLGAANLGLAAKAWSGTGNVLNQRNGYRHVPQY